MSRDNDQQLQVAFSLHQAGSLDKAANIYRQIVDKEPNNFYALHYLGVIEASVGHFQVARSLMARSIAISPPNISFIENYAMILFQTGDYKSALQVCEQGLRLSAINVPLLYVGAISLFRLKRLQESIAEFDKLLLLQPNHLAGNNERGSVLAEMREYDDALASVEKALRIQPRYAEAHLNKGNICSKLKRWPEAIGAYDKALALNPNLTDAWLGHGSILRELKRYDEAFAAYDKALALEPNKAGAWCGRGYVFYELKRYDEALAAYDKALALEPNKANAWNGRGCVLDILKHHAEAAHAFAEALKSDDRFPFAKGMLLHQKMQCCDWRNINDLIAEVDKDIHSGKLSAEPFGWQGVANSERSLQLCAELYNNDKYPAPIISSSNRTLANHKKIRIGYSSGEFRNQATSLLLAGVFELHDNSQFEIYAIDNGWDDKSEIRGRINASVKGIIDVSRLSDSSASAAISENAIDILINLNGYFGESRMQVFAHKPAPIQVNYLGFPGTLGANYIDYIIADRCVIPENHKVFYREKVVYLPNCYQANDRKKKIGSRDFSRQECGLPEKRFVFCCFNNNYKIVPDIFDCWMRILFKVDGSVLWLIEDNRSAVINLKKEAAMRGVNPERLVFAKRIPLEDHLARHRLADLFLDTLPYNAHTTANDALWVGLPVLTQLGETFAGRVAASLLNAVGLPELITKTQEDYERFAIELATDQNTLARIKDRLAQNRLMTPLFNTQLFTHHIEHAYELMYERYQKGLPPDHIYVPQ